MHFGRAVGDRKHWYAHPHFGERRISRSAERTVQADRAVNDVVINPGHTDFAHADMRSRSAVRLVVDDPGCFEHEQAEHRIGRHPHLSLVVARTFQ
jgi:hypothetical protein